LVLAANGIILGVGKKKKNQEAISVTMFIPGIYQLKNKKILKGTILLGSFIGSLAGALSYNKRGNNWYEKYLNSTKVDDIIMFRQQTEKCLKRRNFCIGGMFFVWLLHILDLKFFKSGKGGIKGDFGQNKINLGFYYTF
jgi:hypothetical protein